MSGSRFYIHICHIFFTFCNITFGDFFRRHPFFNCFCNDFIIYIGKVRNIVYIIAFVFHISSYGIEYNHRTCISNMNKVVYRWSAHIHFYFSFFKRYKFFFFLCQCVINFHNPFFSFSSLISCS